MVYYIYMGRCADAGYTEISCIRCLYIYYYKVMILELKRCIPYMAYMGFGVRAVFISYFRFMYIRP